MISSSAAPDMEVIQTIFTMIVFTLRLVVVSGVFLKFSFRPCLHKMEPFGICLRLSPPNLHLLRHNVSRGQCFCFRLLISLLLSPTVLPDSTQLGIYPPEGLSTIRRVWHSIPKLCTSTRQLTYERSTPSSACLRLSVVPFETMDTSSRSVCSLCPRSREGSSAQRLPAFMNPRLFIAGVPVKFWAVDKLAAPCLSTSFLDRNGMSSSEAACSHSLTYTSGLWV